VSGGRDIVTDHAVLRYLERVYGVDVSALRRRIERVTAEARKQGASGLTSDGVKYTISHAGRIVTITGSNGPMTRRGRRWQARHK
jgi:hypothetical protein